MKATLLACLVLLSMPLLAGGPQRINVGNAEDLALIAAGRWVIASSMPGGSQKEGALYAVNTATLVVSKLYPGSGGQLAKVRGCAPVTAAAFAPHGISVQTLSPGRETLFVVNHGGRESIEIFDIAVEKTPSLIWRGCIPLPKGAMANAVAVTPDYRVYITNMGAPIEGSAAGGAVAGSEVKRRWMGDILEWSEKTGWQTVPDSKTYAPNGLLVSDDGAQIFVNSWAGGEVHKLTRSAGKETVRQTMPLPFLPDNLRWGKDGSILAAGLRSKPESVVACVMAKEPCGLAIPTGIAKIRGDAFTVECIRNVGLQMGTSAIPVGDTLWVGPARGESIWVLAKSEASGEQCF